MDKINKINKLIDKSMMKLTEALDRELYIPVKVELTQQKVTHSLGFKKELFKEKMEMEFENLKKEIVKIAIDTSTN